MSDKYATIIYDGVEQTISRAAIATLLDLAMHGHTSGRATRPVTSPEFINYAGQLSWVLGAMDGKDTQAVWPAIDALPVAFEPALAASYHQPMEEVVLVLDHSRFKADQVIYPFVKEDRIEPKAVTVGELMYHEQAIAVPAQLCLYDYVANVSGNLDIRSAILTHVYIADENNSIREHLTTNLPRASFCRHSTFSNALVVELNVAGQGIIRGELDKTTGELSFTTTHIGDKRIVGARAAIRVFTPKS